MKPIKDCYKFYENAFSNDERLKFLNEINFSNIKNEITEDTQTNTAKRKVKSISVPNDNWFVKKIRSYTKKANDELWNFDLNFDQIEINTNQILIYDEQSFYEYHTVSAKYVFPYFFRSVYVHNIDPLPVNTCYY